MKYFNCHISNAYSLRLLINHLRFMRSIHRYVEYTFDVMQLQYSTYILGASMGAVSYLYN